MQLLLRRSLFLVFDESNFVLGVAYSKHVVHVYAYNGSSDLREHLEVCSFQQQLLGKGFYCPGKSIVILAFVDHPFIILELIEATLI